MGDLSSILESLLQPSLPIALLGILIILGGPILLHLILASSSTYTVPPTVLLLGPEGAGKTSLLTLFERGDDGPAPTHTTQTTQAVELSASVDSESRTSFRNHDDTSGTHTKFLMVDTPGHGKLRNVAMGKLARTEKLRALVFVVDAAALGEQDVLAQTAGYLHDVLLFLQKGATDQKSGAAKAGHVPVLIAANKMDLFTALPSTLVKTNLEAELTRIRATRSKGLLDSGVGMDDVGSEEQDGWLGEYGSEKFSFKQMQEFDIDVEILPGNVTGDGPGAEKWWWWIAQKI
jgi:signal recognition particle receptor subunit beta